MTQAEEPSPSAAAQRRDVEDGGVLIYYPHFLAGPEADALFAALQKGVAWKQEKGRFGRLFPRLTALYADRGVVYTYSGVTYPSLVWTSELDAIRRRVEGAAGAPFNSVLLNRYRDGSDSIGWHADDEPELGVNPIVPSISLGAERRFVLRQKKRGTRLEYPLRHGSLLVMAGTLQHHWLHSLPKCAAPAGERINLTFRNILQEE
jgi:alkylated DNA repair dioxygenase AlkB